MAARDDRAGARDDNAILAQVDRPDARQGFSPVRTYILRRIAHMIPVLLGVVTVVFLALRLIPGDPAIALAGEKASAEQIEQMREALGLNRPLPVQYVEFIGRLASGDLGRSIRTGGDIRQELI